MTVRHARLFLTVAVGLLPLSLRAQINTDRMMSVGRNALYFDDYVLSIRYFSQVISAKPYLAEPYFYRAIAKLSLEDFRGAEQDCNSSIERNPFVVNSYQVRGLAKVYQQRYKDAAQDFFQGLKLDPENQSIRHNLVLSLARDGQMEMALSEIDTLLRSWPKYSQGMAMKSDLLWETGDSAQSLEWIDKAVDIDRFDADLQVHRAVLKARMELYDQALPDLNRALYLDPGNVPAYMNRAMVHYMRDSLNASLADYDMVLRIEPSNVTGHYNRGNLRAQVGDDNRAIEDFDFVIGAEPDNWMAIYNRGLLRFNTGDYKGAESDISKVLEQYPEFVLGYQMRSEVREKLGDSRGAEQDALVVLKEHNRRFNRAMGYATDSDDEEKDGSKTRDSKDKNVLNYRKIIVDDDLENSTGFSSEYRGKVQNRNVQVEYLDLLRLTYFQNSRQQIRDIPLGRQLDQLNAGHGFLAEIRFDDSSRSLSLDDINRLFQDIETRTTALDENPASITDLVARALDFCLLQDFPAAMEDMDHAIDMARDSWIVWLVSAQVRYRMLKAQEEVEGGITSGYREVISCLDHVIQLEPDMASAYYNRGTVYAMTDDMHAALVDLTRAIELEPELAEAWFNRAVLQVLMGHTEQAVMDFSKAGELGIVSAYNIIKRFSTAE